MCVCVCVCVCVCLHACVCMCDNKLWKEQQNQSRVSNLEPWGAGAINSGQCSQSCGCCGLHFKRVGWGQRELAEGGRRGRRLTAALTFALLVQNVRVWRLVVDEVDTSQVFHHNVQLIMRLKHTTTSQPCHNVHLTVTQTHNNQSTLSKQQI